MRCPSSVGAVSVSGAGGQQRMLPCSTSIRTRNDLASSPDPRSRWSWQIEQVRPHNSSLTVKGISVGIQLLDRRGGQIGYSDHWVCEGDNSATEISPAK